jgi:Flp pilus assembly CpaE family ATPase
MRFSAAWKRKRPDRRSPPSRHYRSCSPPFRLDPSPPFSCVEVWLERSCSMESLRPRSAPSFSGGRNIPTCSGRRSRWGARGFVRWPEERPELLRLIEGAVGNESVPARGLLVAVWGPKGGSGTSVLTAHLAWALRLQGKSCLLVDLDLDHGDQAMILGVEPKASILDLVPVAGEMTQAALDRVAWSHDSGFRAVLTPAPAPDASDRGPPDVGALSRALGGMGALADVLVLDIPSGLGALPLITTLRPSQIVLVVTADLLALNRSRRAMAGLAAAGIGGDRIHPVLNRRGDGDIRGVDVEAILGCRLSAAVPLEAGIQRASEIGCLSPSGRTLLKGLAQKVAGSPECSSKRRRSFGERFGHGRGG